jgi:hypothetical protein
MQKLTPLRGSGLVCMLFLVSMGTRENPCQKVYSGRGAKATIWLLLGPIRLDSLDLLVYYMVQVLINQKRWVYEFYEVL